MYRYTEIPVPDIFADFIECYWMMEVLREHEHLVVPDGCLDLVFTWRGRRLETVQVVGSMTRPHWFHFSPNYFISGIRFLPGMFPGALGVPVASLTDRDVPLIKLPSASAQTMVQMLKGVRSFEASVATMEEALLSLAKPRPAQRAVHEIYLASMQAQGNRLNASRIAERIQVGERQLRRICLQETGLSPKLLERVARFRRVWLCLHEASPQELKYGLLDLAITCGYSDQAHLSREFQEFVGTSPGRYLKSLS